MKLLIFSLVLSVAFVAAENNSDKYTQKWNEIMLKALKRKYGNSYAESPDDACIKACQNKDIPGEDKISKFQDPNSTKTKLFKEIYNTAMFTEVCKYFNATAACVRACPDTQRRQYLRLILAPLKYVCEESHIVQNADCLGSVYENVTIDCIFGECADSFRIAAEAFRDYVNEDVPTKPLAETLLSKGCLFVKCGKTCSRTYRVQKCGAQADEEIVEFYRHLGNSLEDIRYLSPNDYVVDIPNDCKAQ